ncbi:hypothetical protein MMC13_001498 [Lambiella insularis]|nr:hypothetical protein [Lambiella insularis]
MAPSATGEEHSALVILSQIQETLQTIKQDYQALSAAVDAINGRVNILSGLKEIHEAAGEPATQNNHVPKPAFTEAEASEDKSSLVHHESTIRGTISSDPKEISSASLRSKSIPTSRIILTTYPGQAGIDPLIMNWGHVDPMQRGPVVVSRNQSTLRRRNAIGAHGGSYSIYHALAVASKNLDINHRPDFTNTEPAANIGPFPQWADAHKIVSMDPLGHLAPWLFRDMVVNENVDIRPTIAITKAHMKLPELEHSIRSGRLVPDGKICLNEAGELAVTKFAVEPVWFLPGVAERYEF